MANDQPLNTRALSPETTQILDKIRTKVVGQIDAVEELVQCFVRWKAGLAPTNRPIGIFLFVGPTGVGKTLLAQQFVQAIGHKADSLLRIDCAEFALQHETARLIGAPPGYLGHRETSPLLSQKKLTEQHTPEVPLSVVLFDEMEKAHPTMHDLILGVLDSGSLRLGDNTSVDFSSTIIILTANLGATEIANALHPAFGLAPKQAAPTREQLISQIKNLGPAAARKRLRPEFFNRIDKILTFHPLSEADLDEILNIELQALVGKLDRAQQFLNIKLLPEARAKILADGMDPRYGARHLKRSLSANLEIPLANLIVSGQLKSRDHVEVRCAANGSLEFIEL